MSTESTASPRGRENQATGLQTTTSKPAWRRPTITRIVMKETMQGSGGQGLIVHVH